MAREKQTLVDGTMKLLAGALSAGAALVSILSYTAAHTMPMSSEQVHRLAVTPARDTASSIGDSLQLAAVATDDRGTALHGVEPTWSSADPQVAEVDQAGTVVSRGPGVTAIIVRVGEHEARARIAVVQRAAALRLPDTLMRVPEGELRRASVAVTDARGQAIPGAAVRWETADRAIAAIDSVGDVTGVSPGRSTLTAVVDQLRATFPIEVVPVPASITIVAGEDQRGAAGRVLAGPVSAQIVSRTGRPVAGIGASFGVRDGIGAVTPEVDTSDARGMVQAVWTLGPVPGRQQLAIVVDGVAVSPVLTAEADPTPANTRIILAGGAMVARSGDSLPEPVVVRVTDSTGVPLADVPVAWSTPDGGTTDALSARTDSLGEARARWRLGSTAGRQRLRVQVGNGRLMPASTFAATALPGDPVSLAVRGGDRQSGTVGKALVQPVVVRTLDRHGNPVPGASLRIAPSAGIVSDSLISTDSTGQAGVRWTLPRSSGAHRLTIRLAGSDAAAEVSARARPAGPAGLTFVAPPSTATVGGTLTRPIVVEVTDGYGNRLAGKKVAFTTTSGKTSPAQVTTDSSGRARVTWTLGAKAGAATLAAKVVGSEVQARLTIPAKVKGRPGS